MKKIIIIANIFLISLVANAADKLISFSDMPKNARDFAMQTFPDKKIASVQKDTELFGLITENYKVVYKDGCSIEFNKDGDWTEIYARNCSIPNSAIPEVIVTYISENFKNAPVVSMEKDDEGYEIEMNPDSTLKFNEDFVFLGMD